MTSTLNQASPAAQCNQDGQGIGDDNFSLVPKLATDVLWRHLHSSPEAGPAHIKATFVSIFLPRSEL